MLEPFVSFEIFVVRKSFVAQRSSRGAVTPQKREENFTAEYAKDAEAPSFILPRIFAGEERGGGAC
jgi:hypothetical protein